ncbi:MAG TPA: NlpC/P60 family protein [Balneolaceae bacterium]|nr:NlpC/P60 family protein [Balneolaceae bacterium]
MKQIRTALCLIAIFLLSGCGIARRTARPVPQNGNAGSGNSTSAAQKPVVAMHVSSLNEAQATLMQAYRDWKGTPYKLGGASKKGVDCSMLVNIIFEQYFGIKLPSNTRAQLNTGRGIRRAGVRTGDLVFFRTGRKTLHVGIMVNHGEFLHASTSSGVRISKFGKSYWRNRFLAARRVFSD